METIKIQISEVEGMTIKIPTEFTPSTYKTFYNQMLSISRTLPTTNLVFDSSERSLKATKIAGRIRIGLWGDKEQCLTLLKTWETKGKEETLNWIEKVKGWTLEKNEKSSISNLVAAVRAKYKKELKL